jgi:F0F1-type ATP synthase delta subunit
MLNTYVTALVAELHTESDTTAALKNLRESMEARGHVALYPRVLRATLRRLEAAPAPVTVRVARAEDVAAHTKAIAGALHTLSTPADATPEVVIDETLIGGFRVEHNHRVVDATYKNALISLYHRIIKA